MSDKGRYIAVQIDKRTGCHHLLNDHSLPHAQAISMFHTRLPSYDMELHRHLHRELFMAHEDCSGIDKTESPK